MKCDQFKIHFDVIFLTLIIIITTIIIIIIRLMIIETCPREGRSITQYKIIDSHEF